MTDDIDSKRIVSCVLMLPWDLINDLGKGSKSISEEATDRLRQSFAEDRIHAALARIEAKLGPAKVPYAPLAQEHSIPSPEAVKYAEGLELAEYPGQGMKARIVGGKIVAYFPEDDGA